MRGPCWPHRLPVPLLACLLAHLQLPCALGAREEEGLLESLEAASADASLSERAYEVDRPKVFVAVLSAPGEGKQREAWRRACWAELQAKLGERAKDVGYQFFVGVGESPEERQRVRAHDQALSFQRPQREQAARLSREAEEHRDLWVVPFADAYGEIWDKLVEIMRVGSDPRELGQAWQGFEPNFIAKTDIDMCYDHDKFVAGLQNYYRAAPGSATQLLMKYRPLEKGQVALTQGGATSKGLGDVPYYHRKIQRLAAEAPEPQSFLAGSKPPVYPVLANMWWMTPGFEQQKGLSMQVEGDGAGYQDGMGRERQGAKDPSPTFFEPYPSGPCYAVPAALAARLVSGRMHDKMVLTRELESGRHSDDLSFGYALSRAVADLNVGVDLVQTHFAHERPTSKAPAPGSLLEKASHAPGAVGRLTIGPGARMVRRET